MLLKKCLFVIFLLTFFQNPVFSDSSEEIVFYEQILDSYESNNMKKFYSLLSKFEKIYPDSQYKESLFTLAAKSLYEDKQYANALFFIEHLDNPSGLMSYQAECYLHLKNYDKVINLYRNAIPRDLISRQILASAFIGIANDKAENSQKRAEAASLAIEVLESQSLESMPEDTLLALSKLHFRSNQFKRSAKVLQHLIKSSASNKEELLIHLSLVQKKYNYKSAIKTLDETLKLNGNLKDVAAYHKMMVLFENKQYKTLISSRSSLKSYLDKEKLPLLNYYLGLAFLSNNEYSEAEKEFKSYLKNPADYETLKLFAIENLKTITDRKKEFLPNDTLSELANLYLQSNQHEKSARVLKEILKNNPSNKEEVLLQLSLAQKNFSPNSALRTLEEVIKLNGVNKQIATYQKMEVLFDNMQYNSLISSRDFLQRNLSSENLPLLHYFLGVAYLKEKKYSDSEIEFNSYLKDVKNYSKLKASAQENLREIAEIKSKLKLNYKELTAYKKMIALFKSKQYNNLISSKEKLQKTLNPEKMPLLHYFLGEAFLKKDMPLEAEEEFNAYLADIRGYSKFKEPALENLKAISNKKAKEKKTHMELASYRKMIALFNNGKYSNLISYKEKLQKSLNPNDLPLLHYFLGIAFLKNDEYMESEKAFNIYLSDTKEHEDLKLNALKYLRSIAKKKNDVTLLSNVETSIASLANERSTGLIKEDTFKANVDLSTALTLKRKKKFDEAEKILITLLKSEKTQEKGSVYFELAHIYYLGAKYLKAKNLFMSFIKRNPNSSLVPLAWSHYIDASIEFAQNSDNKYAKAQLMYDTKICLKNNKYLSQLERVELMFLLAKTQYELSSFEEAIETINTLIKSKRIENDTLAKCYLVLGYSYKNGLNDNESFISYIKKATKIDPSLLSNKKIQALLESFSKNNSDDIQANAN